MEAIPMIRAMRAEQKVVALFKRNPVRPDLLDSSLVSALPIWIARASGELEYASPAFLDLLGMSLEECNSTHWGGCLPTAPADKTASAKRCVACGAMCECEHRLPGNHGELRTFLSRSAAIRDGEGDPVRWVGISVDISERSRSEKELERSNDELRSFAATLTHDLRSPLASVGGLIGVLKE
jgi:PAS domain S-box-containing protein